MDRREIFEYNYRNVIESWAFKKNLSELNTSLVKILEKNNHEPMLLGNLFYHHKAKEFNKLELNEDMAEKRIRILNAVRDSNKMFEIGFNGGHSALLCLHANSRLNLIFNDIASYFDFIPEVHPEIYVPQAISNMQQFFPDRISGIIGDSLTEIPKFVKENPDIRIDFVHIDGYKPNYKLDFFNLMPIISDRAKIVIDDSNMPSVQFLVNFLVRAGYVSRLTDYPTMKNKYSNEIVIFSNSSPNFFKKFFAHTFFYLDNLFYILKVNFFRPFKLIKRVQKKLK